MAKQAPPPEPPMPPPLKVSVTKRYVKDAERARKRKLDIDLLTAVVRQLSSRQPLAGRHRDHALTGDWNGFRECHIRPDWLLIYHVDGDRLILDRTGSHSDLFG